VCTEVVCVWGGGCRKGCRRVVESGVGGAGVCLYVFALVVWKGGDIGRPCDAHSGRLALALVLALALACV
jgi:hypothetical protein